MKYAPVHARVDKNNKVIIPDRLRNALDIEESSLVKISIHVIDGKECLVVEPVDTVSTEPYEISESQLRALFDLSPLNFIISGN